MDDIQPIHTLVPFPAHQVACGHAGRVPVKPHQWGHVASVHLPNQDLLLRRGHAANVEGLRPAGARAHHGRQRHRAVLHLPGPVELLLQDGGPAGEGQFGSP